MLDELCKVVCDLHGELPRNGLVTWTSGNISARDPLTGRIVIKPSGLRYDELSPELMVVVDLDGSVIEGTCKPSSDVLTHCYIYRHLPEVNGVVHTHSPFATAWAATGRDIPCVLTAMADEFGGPIPCGGFARIGGEEIGREVMRVFREGTNPGCPAVLLQNHGVFAVGPSALAALKAAVMCEDVARTVAIACSLGKLLPISDEDVLSLRRRYLSDYGQPQRPT